MTAALDTRLNGNEVPVNGAPAAEIDTNDGSYILSGKHTQQVVTAIDAAHAAGLTPILWGLPGVGKTALVDALAKRPGFGGIVRVLTGSQDKSDTLGMPSRATFVTNDLDASGAPIVLNTTEHATPHWALWANNQQGTVYVFLDEFPQADTDVQGTFLTVLQNHVMPSGMKLKSHVKFIAAGNPTDVVASGYELIEPLQNRLMHLNYEPPIQEWFQGMIEAWGKKVSPEEATFRAYIVAYLQRNNKVLHDPPKAGSTENAWPSRRSWDNYARTAAPFMSDKDMMTYLGSALIGDAAAQDFVTTMFRIKTKTPAEIMANPACVDWTHSFQGFVALSSVVNAIDAKEKIPAVVDVFNYAVHHGPRDMVSVWVKPFTDRATEFSSVLMLCKLDMSDKGFKEYMPIIFPSKKRVVVDEDE